MPGPLVTIMSLEYFCTDADSSNAKAAQQMMIGLSDHPGRFRAAPARVSVMPACAAMTCG